MATKIDEAQVRRVALLSRLELSDEEVTQFSGQLSAIVEYIEKLNELDTENTPQTSHVLGLKNVFRKDESLLSLPNETALSNAPEKESNHFKVPKII